MIFFVISCFSFILLLSKSFSLKRLQAWNTGIRVSSLSWFWIELSHFLNSSFTKNPTDITSFEVSTIPPLVKQSVSSELENMEQEEGISLLDLPELALESILERLSIAELCSMARVCSALRDRCTSDHLWGRHMKQKWGNLIGQVALREWQWHIASSNTPTLENCREKKLFLGYASSLWHILWSRSKLRTSGAPGSSLPVDSIMARYLALESGKFWFPAQVYNREHGNIGFMLSCYDAELSYDSSTDSFKARYSTHGRRTVEENIVWDRLRAPAVDIPAHVLHVSDCLDDLNPGDHIEIQWRRNHEFPYGWWYGVVGHVESCEGSRTHCQCHNSDTVILEFKQYTPGSRWRTVAINRKHHREVGNAVDGFYGGIRKLYNNKEISIWQHLWPTKVLE